MFLFTSQSGQQTDKGSRQLNEQNNKHSNSNFPQQNEEGETERARVFLSANRGAGCLISILWGWHLNRSLVSVCAFVCLCVCASSDKSSRVCPDTLPSAAPSVPQVFLSTQIPSLLARPLDSFPTNSDFIHYLFFAEEVETFESHCRRGQRFSLYHVTKLWGFLLFRESKDNSPESCSLPATQESYLQLPSRLTRRGHIKIAIEWLILTVSAWVLWGKACTQLSNSILEDLS